MLVSSAVVLRFLGETGAISISQVRWQQHFHLHPAADAALTDSNSISTGVFPDFPQSIYGFFPLSAAANQKKNASQLYPRLFRHAIGSKISKGGVAGGGLAKGLLKVGLSVLAPTQIKFS